MISYSNPIEHWVKPENVDERTKYQLSDADYIITPPQFQFLLIYKNHQGVADFMPTEQLLEGLRKMLEQNPILAGRLAQVDGVDYEIRMTGNGAPYREVQCDKDISSFNPNWPQSSLLPEWQAVAWNTETDVIFAARVIRFANNSGLALCASTQQYVTDGASYCMALKAWAAFTRGETPPPPVHNRDLLRLPADLRHMVRKPTPEELVKPTYDHGDPSKCAIMFRIRPENLARLKAAAIESVSDEERNNGWFSTVDAVVALFWRAHVRVNKVPADKILHEMAGINMRHYLTDLPKNYFGNAIETSIMKITAGELLSRPLGDIALFHRRVLLAASRATRDEWLKWANTGNAPSVINRCLTLENGIDYITTDITKFGACTEMDFGYGNAIVFRRPAHPAKTTTTFLETAPCPETGKQGIDISAMVKNDTYDQFINDSELITYAELLDTN
ncbi:transferase [Syncephalis plumigaleata]|nr:transferase [Syncephalis plumigaleata]